MESLSISSVSGESVLESRASVSRPASANAAAAAQSRIHMIRRPGQGDLIAEVTGRGRPVILIHGWAVDRRMWALQVPALKRRFKVITFDRRGFGQSTCPAGLEQELDDLDALLDHFKLDGAALIGMSQGGRLAMRYAASRPNRVTALVLQGAPLDGLTPPPFDPSIIPTARLASLMRAGNRGDMIQLLGDHVLMERDARSATARAALQAMLRDYRGEDLQMAPPVEQPLEDARMMLGQITAPTIVVTGSRETIWLRQVADFTARNIRGARRRVIRGGRHFVNMTHPTDYNRCVVDFLERITTPWSERALGIS